MAEQLNLERKGPPSFRRLFSVPTLISIAVAAGLLIALVVRFDIDLSASWRQVLSANIWLYALALAANFCGLAVRALRWRIIAGNTAVDQDARNRIPGMGDTMFMVLGGWFWNSVGWLRMGDAYRAFSFGRSPRIPFSQSVGIIAAERAIDVVTLLPLLILAVAGTLTLTTGGVARAFLLVSLGMASIAVVFVLLLATMGKRFLPLVPKNLQPYYEQFSAGILGGFKRLPTVGLLSVVIWLLEALRLYLVVLALGVPVGPALSLFVALVNAILTTIPFTPGGTGFVEPGMVGVLSLTLTRESAVAVALLDRSISYGSVVAAGGLGFAFYELVLQRRKKPTHSA